MKSDIFPIYNPEEFLLSSHLNFDYLSPNLNLFPTFPMHQYPFNSSVQEDYISQLAKQMAYYRMVQEIEQERTNKKSKTTTNFSNPSSSILTESMNVNHIVNDIMIRTLNDIYEEQIKQQPARVSKQEELLFVKKPNNNNDAITVLKSKKTHQV